MLSGVFRMFGITYDTWNQVCKMYFGLSKGCKKAYLQWFPFSKMSESDERYIMSEAFFEKYIKNASFVLFPEAMHQSENFLQKGDGSFRDSSLLSPILYLVLQAIGKEIHNHYQPIRSVNIDAFYAGNYEYMRAKYKVDYDNFYKLINSYICNCTYFIKTDITNFFPNINLDILMNKIDERSNVSENNFTPTQLKMIKEFLAYCGSGRFPTVENSVASSFLSTVIYLDEIDDRIYKFINEKIDSIDAFKIIRYVDDMYILIKDETDILELHNAYNQIRNEYSSILKEYGLSLNTKKCCIKPKKDINEELKKSLYDEYFNGIQHNIEDLFVGKFQMFLDSLLDSVEKDCIDVERYNSIIEECFGNNSVEFTPTEVFNYFVYECENTFESPNVAKTICRLIKTDISFISLDPKRLSIMIMKTKNTEAIKSLLNELFTRDRNGCWNTYDTSIAISYLIQSEFRHIDLLKVLNKNSKSLEDYYKYCCKTSFAVLLRNKRFNDYVKVIDSDWKAYFLYFMYLIEKQRHDVLAEFAFFKNFFDRFNADLDFFCGKDSKSKKPNYNGFYQESAAKKLYKEIPGSDKIIREAHKLRNSNPLSHASAELIDSKSTSKDLKNSINDLISIINEYMDINWNYFR